MSKADEVGRFTKTDFSKLVAELTNNKPNNLKNYFHLVPDADEALILAPQNDKQKASGRAPYARPVLKQVVEEVMRGEDPAKPALSIQHPHGEEKSQDGILYCLTNPESEVCKLQANRTVEQQTNNHLVRHRMLIFGRLLRDMVAHYAQGNPSRVTMCCLEVNRNLKEFSGLNSKEIAKLLSEKQKHFNSAKKHLQKHAPNLPLTAGLIRKCRIAMDLNWTCPYTGMVYSATDLPKLDREHIIPFATRNTNALSAQVLTFPEVNALKGKRTGLEFIREFQGQHVAGRENLTICSEKIYKKFVESLKTQGPPDDQKRKKLRKKLLLVEKSPERGDIENKLGFTEGQLTQSSQLMKLGAQIIKKQLSQARIISIPGQVTAETRKAWKLMGTLSRAVPEIIADNGEGIKEKDEIRSITHLHHAVDACTLGLIPLLIPSGDNGRIWRLILQRRINEDDMKFLKQETSSSILSFTNKNAVFLKDVPTTVKDSMAHALLERRVIRHVPADMGGAMFDEQYKGIKKSALNNSDCNIVVRSKNKKSGKFEYTKKVKSKVFGFKSSKLSNNNSVLIISSNYGIAIDPEPTIIRHVCVYKQLQTLIQKNNGKPVRILRAGQLVKVSGQKNQNKNKIWKITSIKDNQTGLALDLQIPESAISANATNPHNWINVSLASLLKNGLSILPYTYIGY